MAYRNDYYCPGCDEGWDNNSNDPHGDDACPHCMAETPPYDSTLISMLPALPAVGSSRGAPMGRRSDQGDPDWSHEFVLELLPMVDGDYDVGGAYWGSGDRDIGWMYRAHANGEEEILDLFLRAKSWEEAKEAILADYPNATIKRGL